MFDRWGYVTKHCFSNDLNLIDGGTQIKGTHLYNGMPHGGKATVIPAESLVPRILKAVEKGNSVTFVGSAAGGTDAQPEKVSWANLHKDARAMAAILQARGIVPGDHVALLGPTTRSLVTAVQAIWLAGACVIMLPIPIRLNSIEEFMNQTRAHLIHGEVDLLLLDPAMANFYEAKESDPPILILSDLRPGPDRPSTADYKEVSDDPNRLAIMQFTSGSTSEPKGVMLPNHVIGSNIDGMWEAASIVPDDVFVSWLPLYHDMGLVGMLTVPMTVGSSLVLAAPQDFMSRPGNWMRWLSDYKGTISAGPNFSWVLATRALRRMTDTNDLLDLSNMRIALNGAEPVDPDGVDKFVNAAKRHGFRPGAEFCAFGMAEVAIGGSFPTPMRGLACDTVDRLALEEEGVARPADPALPNTRRLPLLGRPVPGLEMRVCDPASGEELGLRKVGELEIRGPSVTLGYYKRPDLADTLFRDGWLRTGDLAYFVDSPEGGSPELVICGRIKDLIIISGRNIYPEDIERAVGTVEGVRTGNVISFSVEGSRGKEVIIVVAEVKGEDYDDIRKNIRRRAIDVCEVPPRDIMLVQPGSIPKTSSGKLQRSLCKKQYLQNELKLAD